ncbi:MAG: nucleotidyltransferase family protein [Parasphingorhabdus sp.]|uniref:nucleotidyltransferase family protein n=1 Tax=Parasphingorhabdus sp. TaxID=2709688 RepID=UPI003002CA8D
MARPTTSSGHAPALQTATDLNAYAPTGSAGRGFVVFVRADDLLTLDETRQSEGRIEYRLETQSCSSSLMQYALALKKLMMADPSRWAVLDIVRSLDLADCWVGAGFVRDAVWDNLHGRMPSELTADIDVIWFGSDDSKAAKDRALEAELHRIRPDLNWSVKNQARMNERNGDADYRSATDAMCFWPETATAVAVRRSDQDQCEIAAPFGLDDLFELRLTAAGRFANEKRSVFLERLEQKQWLQRYPKLRIIDRLSR